MDSASIPTDGPETVLGEAVRRLKLRYSRTFVARSVAAHSQPGSLLALVEVAKSLGVKATAGRTDATELEGMGPATIIHFDGAEGGGFGLLEAVTDDGFKVWDSLHGSHAIGRDAFLARWTGVVALLEREGLGPPEKGYVRNRLTEVVFSGYDPPALVANPAANVLRVLFAALLGALVALAVSSLPAPDRPAATAVTLLALVGLGVTTITAVSIGAQEGSLSDRICARGKLVDCHSVLSSRYSRIFGISLSDIGIALFGSILLLVATGAAGAGSVWPVVTIAFVASVPLSLTLVGVQVAMRQLCTLCLAVHAVNLSAAAISWLWLRPQTWPPRDLAAGVLLMALFFCLLLFLAIPYFRKHQGLRVMVGKYRRISGSPFASLAEVLTETPAALSPPDCAVSLGEPGAADDVVIFVHPSCGKCDVVLQQVWALAQSGIVNAAVGLAPKDPEETDRSACAAVVAAGLSGGGERMILAYAAAKRRLRAMMSDDPVATLAAELQVPAADIEATLAEARRRTAGAEAIVDAHAEGTPAVFFNERLFRGELNHLVFLLQQHPDLLAPTRGAAAEAGRVAEEASS